MAGVCPLWSLPQLRSLPGLLLALSFYLLCSFPVFCYLGAPPLTPFSFFLSLTQHPVLLSIHVNTLQHQPSLCRILLGFDGLNSQERDGLLSSNKIVCL